MLYSVGSFVYSIVHFNNVLWFIFLTTWGNVICVLYLCAGTYISLFYRNNQQKCISNCSKWDCNEMELTSPREDHDEVTFQTFASTNVMPKKIRIFWLLSNLAYMVGGLIVIMYWGFVHRQRFLKTPGDYYDIINFHGIIYFLVLIDFFMGNVPIRILHTFYVILFGLTYAVFSAIYTMVSGRWIYPVIKWKTAPKEAVIFCVLALGVLVVLQLLFYGVYRLRKRCQNNNYSV
jgi:FAR-17a/AIG1-like protein.